MCTGWLGTLAACLVSKTLQGALVKKLLGALHLKTAFCRPPGGSKAWSIEWLCGCLVATVTRFSSCFGGILGKGSPAWVSGPAAML